MQKVIILFGLCILLALSACAKEIKKDNRPDWIDKPQGYFVSRCAIHEGELQKLAVGSLQLKTFKSFSAYCQLFSIS